MSERIKEIFHKFEKLTMVNQQKKSEISKSFQLSLNFQTNFLEISGSLSLRFKELFFSENFPGKVLESAGWIFESREIFRESSGNFPES